MLAEQPHKGKAYNQIICYDKLNFQHWPTTDQFIYEVRVQNLIQIIGIKLLFFF